MANITGTSRFLRILAERGTTGLVELTDEDLSFNGSHTIQSVGGTLTLGAFTLGGAITGGGQVLSNLGTVYIGDTANANQTLGLTINQGAADDEILSLKSSDVAHGMTALTETDTFVSLVKASAAVGGLRLYVYGDDGAGNAMHHAAYTVTAADTTKSTSGYGVHRFESAMKGTTGTTGIGADGNLLSIDNRGTTRFIFDAEGSGHADVEWTTYDKYNDLALLSNMESILTGVETPGMTYRRHELETAGIIGKDSWHFENEKPRAMVNFTKLAMLHHGAFIQVAERMSLIEAENKMLREKLEIAGLLN